jgi:hypothetical protein
LEKKKWWYGCRLLGTKSLKEGDMWHIHPSLDIDRETNNKKMAIAEQQLEPLLGSSTHATMEVMMGNDGSGVCYVVRSEVISQSV